MYVTIRQSSLLGFVPCLAAASVTSSHCLASGMAFGGPPAMSENIIISYCATKSSDRLLPTDGVASFSLGCWYDRSCSAMSWIVQYFPSYVIGSGDSSSFTMMSVDSRIIGFRSCGGIRNLCGSVGSPLGPIPSTVLPLVRWSRNANLSAMWNGWCNGSDTTPVPSVILVAVADAFARTISGIGIVSHAAEWCSPMKNSS